MPESGAVWRVREAMDVWLHKGLPADFNQLRTDMEHILSCMPASTAQHDLDGIEFRTEVHPSGWPLGYRYMCSKCPPHNRWGWRTEHLEDHNVAVARLRDHHAKEHPMNPEPQDPFTTMGAGAMSIHEMYTSLTAAGFASEQALYLTAQIVTGGKGTPPPPPPPQAA